MYEAKFKNELYHHGILGQKWGDRNGPPYPLDGSQVSASEKKAGWRPSRESRDIARRKVDRTYSKEEAEYEKIESKYKDGKQILSDADYMKELKIKDKYQKEREEIYKNLYKDTSAGKIIAGTILKDIGANVVGNILFNATGGSELVRIGSITYNAVNNVTGIIDLYRFLKYVK